MEIVISFLTLTFLEIVLGIDNIIFISIIAEKAEKEKRKKARLYGLSLALIMRILLLSFVSYLAHFKNPIFSLYSFDLSIRDIIMFAGGLFLLAKSTSEIHAKISSLQENEQRSSTVTLPLSSIIFQILLIDIVFSFDSILTAIGLVEKLWIMVAAVIISILLMLLFSEHVASFIQKYPTMKMLALAFLLMIGTLLILDAFHIHVPRGYIYFSLAFSLFVEILNLRIRKKVS